VRPVADRDGVSRMAEQPALYGVEDPPDPTPPSEPAAAGAWPVPGELISLRRRMHDAIGLVQRGRHTPGIRRLRQALAGLARRDDWEYAAGGAIALGSFLLQRGHPDWRARHLQPRGATAPGRVERPGRWRSPPSPEKRGSTWPGWTRRRR
jgi:hypothetical protein